MIDLPAPPVPADCDLRDFPYLPLDVVRLRDSGLAATASGDEFRAAVLLWCAAWHQIPAGSLPDDTQVIAHLAGYGRDKRGWSRVCAGAMRGWKKSADGRLYHPAVAEKAAEAWAAKQARNADNAGDAERKRREREDRARLFEQARAAGHVPAWNTTTGELRAMVGRDLSQPVTRDTSQPVTPDVTVLNRREGKEKGEGGRETAPPTPRPLDLLGKALRRRGLSSAPQAIAEWSDFLQGSCKIKTADEVPRALDLILEAAKRDGVVVAYSKHAAAFAEGVARTLKTERKQTP